MVDALSGLGEVALALYWWPLGVWSAIVLVVHGGLARLPIAYAPLQFDVRLALLASLPASVLFAAVSYLFPSAPVVVHAVPVAVMMDISSSSMDTAVFGSPWYLVGLATVVVGIIVVAQIVRLLFEIGALRRSRSTMVSVPQRTQRIFERVCVQSHVRRTVRLMQSDSVRVPLVFGWIRPVIVIPTALVDRDDALPLVFLHELAHVNRGDVFAMALARAVTAFFGVSPVVHLLVRSQILHCETACDRLVLQYSDARPSAYARLLFEYVRGPSPHRGPQLSMQFGSPSSSQLKQRIRAMTAMTPSRTYSRISLPLAAFVIALIGSACTSPAVDDAAPSQADVTDASSVDQMPSIVGGMDALQAELQYPEIAKKAGIEGRTIVTFTVTADGQVSDAVVARGIDGNDGGLNAEALRAVESLRFEPGMKDGNPVAVQMTLPIAWRLN